MYEESDGKEEHLVLVMLKGAPGLAFHGPPIPPFFLETLTQSSWEIYTQATVVLKEALGGNE